MARARALRAKPHTLPVASAGTERPAGTRRPSADSRSRRAAIVRSAPAGAPAPGPAGTGGGCARPARASQGRGPPAVTRPPGWLPAAPLRLRAPRARGAELPGPRRREAGPVRTVRRDWRDPGTGARRPRGDVPPGKPGRRLLPLHRHPSSPARYSRPPAPRSTCTSAVPTPVSLARTVLEPHLSQLINQYWYLIIY